MVDVDLIKGRVSAYLSEYRADFEHGLIVDGIYEQYLVDKAVLVAGLMDEILSGGGDFVEAWDQALRRSGVFVSEDGSVGDSETKEERDRRLVVQGAVSGEDVEDDEDEGV